MTRQSRIEEIIRTALNPVFLHAENESHLHRSSPDGESHYKLVIISAGFEGMRLPARHRTVYAVLAGIMPEIHALALHTYTPAEFEQSGQSAPKSPACAGFNPD